MKKIINSPDHVVSEMLEGMAKAHPELVYFKEAEVIARKEKGKLALYQVAEVDMNPLMLVMLGKVCWTLRCQEMFLHHHHRIEF